MLDCWGKLLGLKTELLFSQDYGATLQALPLDATVIEVYSDDVEQAMFLVAANRMAELLGIELFRLDIEDGKPQFVVSFGVSVKEARERMEAFYEGKQEEVELGLDGVGGP